VSWESTKINSFAVLDGGVEMVSDLPENGELYLDDGFWKLRLRDVAEKSDFPEERSGSMGNTERDPIWVGIANGPKGLTKLEAREMIDAILLSQLRRQTISQRSSMTVAEFVEHKFIPEYLDSKTFSGRIHYQSMLKYVVNPEEVDRILRVYTLKRRTRLRLIADWPYLGHLPLREVRPESVQHLASFALNQGYSTQTAAHIRNVVSTIFDFAKEKSCFLGQNPAQPVVLPRVTRAESPRLTHAEIVRLISNMEYPVREMTLIAIILGMNVGEICGLQWRRVNLSEKESSRSDGEVIPSRSIIVREEWVRSHLIAVPQRRKSTRMIPRSLLPILRDLKCREEFAGPEDFVLVSRRGNPINASNVLKDSLKSIGREITKSSLSWQHLPRIRRALMAEIGSGFQAQMERLVHAVYARDRERPVDWRGLVESELPY